MEEKNIQELEQEEQSRIDELQKQYAELLDKYNKEKIFNKEETVSKRDYFDSTIGNNPLSVSKNWRNHYQPWYNDSADFNTNALSYYDYLARYNNILHLHTNYINHLLKRNLNFLDSETITSTITNSWEDLNDLQHVKNKINFSKEYSNYNFYSPLDNKLKTFKLSNASKNVGGLFVPDYKPVIEEIMDKIRYLTADENDTEVQEEMVERLIQQYFEENPVQTEKPTSNYIKLSSSEFDATPTYQKILESIDSEKKNGGITILEYETPKNTFIFTSIDDEILKTDIKNSSVTSTTKGSLRKSINPKSKYDVTSVINFLDSFKNSKEFAKNFTPSNDYIKLYANKATDYDYQTAFDKLMKCVGSNGVFVLEYVSLTNTFYLFKIHGKGLMEVQENDGKPIFNNKDLYTVMKRAGDDANGQNLKNYLKIFDTK